MRKILLYNCSIPPHPTHSLAPLLRFVVMYSFQVLNATRKTKIAAHVTLADTSQSRRVGLLNHTRLEPEEGLYIPPRSWLPFTVIHTIRMKFTIDVFFLYERNRVVALDTLPPNRILWSSGACGVLETAAGTIPRSRTAIGDTIEMIPPESERQNGKD